VAHLDITLEQPGSVTLRIYDLSGRQVREIPAGLLQSGSTRMDWDGTDDDGAALPPGMYSIRVEGAGPAICRAVMLLR
jgi:flagellar hook assembly protein FlgD